MIGRLRRRFLARDLRRQPAATAALAVLLVISALLMASGGIVVERLLGSVDRLFDEAQPPHFLQMHRGPIDIDALTLFAEQHPEIDAWLIEQMLGFDGAVISWTRSSPASATTPSAGNLSESLVDHLFVTQNSEFDFLLDEAGTAPHPAEGEVYVPVSEQQRYDLHRGDELRVGTGEEALPLRIAGFVRDAQMASSFASSSRFLVSEDDFALLTDLGGAPESIIEYRLDDPGDAAAFQSRYEANPDLPRNGQAATYATIRMLNAISDGLVVVALVFASLLIMVIAFVNLRFVIRGALEQEVREIGALKAVGLSRASIAGLYFAKYRLIALAACLIGGTIAPFTAGSLLAGVQTNYGSSPPRPASVIVPVAALGLVYLMVTALCHGILRQIGRIDTVRALVFGSTVSERTIARRARRKTRRDPRPRLRSGGVLPLTTRLSLRELRVEWRHWALLPFVFALATVLVTLPSNLLSTLESPRFVTYLGAPDSDLRSDLQFRDDLDDEHRRLISTMRDDDRLTAVRSFTRIAAEARHADATHDSEWQSLPVEVGDYADTSLEFLVGTRPGRGQIALSALAADGYGIGAGDRLHLRRVLATEEEPVELEISGIYQDVTSGGRTAKLHDPDHLLTAGPAASGFVVYADTATGIDPIVVAADYNRRLPAATTVPMHEYVQQTLSFATTSLRGSVVVAVGCGIVVVGLITALFLTLFMTRARKSLGSLHTLGFSAAEIRRGIRFKTALALSGGVLVGTAASSVLGDSALTAVLSGLGIVNLTLTPDPWLAWVAYPLALTAAGILTAVVTTRRLPGVTGASCLR